MDQMKIGRFIAACRKEKGMTQKELAKQVGVSDKAVSKWECGNGMPELSILMPLCQMLQVNVNELLSGERLSGDSYSKKAEENIMNLMQEKEKDRKKDKMALLNAALVLALSVGVVLGEILWLWLVDGHSLSKGQFSAILVDFSLLIPMILIVALTLSVSGLWKAFFRVFGILFARREYSAWEVNESGAALKLAGNMWLFTGILSTVLSMISALWDVEPFPENFAYLVTVSAPVLAFVLLGAFYGVAGKMLFLPLQSKLEVIIHRMAQQD